MWQRFTERARQIFFFAQEEAGRWGENYVSTEHILLGMLREEQCIACRILQRMDVSLAQIRGEIERQMTRGAGRLGQDMQLTPRGKRVIDLAYDEARQLSNKFIGTEHLLLGLIREHEGLAGRVLAKLGVDLERTRREVMALQDRGEVAQESQTPHDTIENRMHRLFALALKQLPHEQLAALLGDGLPLNQLDDVPRRLIEMMFHVHSHIDPASASATAFPLEIIRMPQTGVGGSLGLQGGNFVLDPKGVVRVNLTKAENDNHFTVTMPVTFLANLLVKDDLSA
jgi:hypothetical protein